jgi:hypothetical protein
MPPAENAIRPLLERFAKRSLRALDIALCSEDRSLTVAALIREIRSDRDLQSHETNVLVAPAAQRIAVDYVNPSFVVA